MLRRVNGARGTMSEEKRLVIVGVSGRLGRELRDAVRRRQEAGEKIQIIGGLVAESDPSLGESLSVVDGPVVSDWVPEFNAADVIIDFSSPEGAMKAVAAARTWKIPLLECSTGLDIKEEAVIQDLATVVPFIRSRNTSVGVNVARKLVYEAAKMLGEKFEVELVELHHRYKKDAPSGTAYLLLEEVARARDVPLADVLNLGRSGVGVQRKGAEIGAQAVRGGDVAGEHTVYYFSDAERIEITHRATSPRIFAEGALRAADWLITRQRSGRGPGSFTMFDVLGSE